MRVSNKIIKDAMNGLEWVHSYDRLLANEMKWTHLRGGKITANHCGGMMERKYLLNKEVLALGYDSLGNIIYITPEGFMKQGF